MTLRILAAGLLTTVQDAGRPGYQHIGVPVGGAADSFSAQIANMMVGNESSAALIECTLGGLRCHVAEDTLIALTGADIDATVNGQPLPLWRPVWLRRHTTLMLGRVQRGCRSYLAVAGGIDCASVLGSRSTLMRAGFGGWRGRALQVGDELPLARQAERVLSAPAALRNKGTVLLAAKWFVSYWRDLDLHAPAMLRLMQGPDWPALTAAAQQTLVNATFRVHLQSDRMALRLTGRPLDLRAPLEKISAGVAPGAMQLPPSGEPFVLLADCQTTGGYPLVAVVAHTDLARLAQLRPGDTVQFVPCTLAQAHRAEVERDARLQEIHNWLLNHDPFN